VVRLELVVGTQNCVYTDPCRLAFLRRYRRFRPARNLHTVSLLYLNPPYDWESGESNNLSVEFVFLEHTVIPLLDKRGRALGHNVGGVFL